MNPPELDRRRSPRYGIHIRVLYFSKGQPRGVDAECDNISVDGVFIRTRRRGPEVGTPVSLLLTFGDTPGEIMVEGVVRRQTILESQDGGTENHGIGIEFVDLDAEVKQVLARTIANRGIANVQSAE